MLTVKAINVHYVNWFGCFWFISTLYICIFHSIHIKIKKIKNYKHESLFFLSSV